MSIDIQALGPAAQRVLAEGTPAGPKMMASKGIVPGAQPDEIVSIVVALSESADPKLKASASQTLQTQKLPGPVLQGALGHQLQEGVVASLATHYGTDTAVLPKLLQQTAMSQEILVAMARGADEAAGEIIGTNEALILRYPAVIEKLYMNKRVRMSTADRLIDLAVRNGLDLEFSAFKQAAAAIQDQLVAEPTEEPTYQDKLFTDMQEKAEEIDLGEDEDVVETDEEGNEEVAKKALPLFAQIQAASVTEKIRMAQLGEAAARLMLVRDKNRLVAEAAAKSPKMTENEGAQIAAMRSVSEEVLRIIAMNRELVRSYQVKLNLINNPRTPFTFSSRLIPHLRAVDLKLLSRSKNVPGAVAKVAKQALQKRR